MSAAPLSSRATHFTEEWGSSLSALNSVLGEPYDANERPDGVANLGVSESSLLNKELLTYYNSHFRLELIDLTYGTSVCGRPDLREALAALYNKYFHPLHLIQPGDIIISAGSSASLAQLIWHIADFGEGILIVEPYYYGFDTDLGTLSQVKLIGVPCNGIDPLSPAAIFAVEDALKKANISGITIRAVLVCNPHNPLAHPLPRATLLAYAKFCESHDLHLISDEIYGLSVFSNQDFPDPPPFVSMLSIDVFEEVGCDPSRVHIVAGASKDFASNGLRLGTLISPSNPALLNSIRCTATLMKPSSSAEVLWACLLKDESYLSWYIMEHKRQLGSAYDFLTSWARKHKIPYLPGCAGFFIMIDFSRFLPTKDRDSRPLGTDDSKVSALIDKMLTERVFVASGKRSHYPTPGWFRITFSLERSTMEVALTRLEQVLGLCHSESALLNDVETYVERIQSHLRINSRMCIM